MVPECVFAQSQNHVSESSCDECVSKSHVVFSLFPIAVRPPSSCLCCQTFGKRSKIASLLRAHHWITERLHAPPNALSDTLLKHPRHSTPLGLFDRKHLSFFFASSSTLDTAKWRIHIRFFTTAVSMMSERQPQDHGQKKGCPHTPTKAKEPPSTERTSASPTVRRARSTRDVSAMMREQSIKSTQASRSALQDVPARVGRAARSLSLSLLLLLWVEDLLADRHAVVVCVTVAMAHKQTHWKSAAHRVGAA